MIYIDHFIFPDEEEEWDFLFKEKRTCYNTVYPFKIICRHRLKRIDFEPVTILYGGNGSGKSTVLNIIAEKLQVKRDSVYNKTNFFPFYVDMCDYVLEREIPEKSRIITSDDVFDYMLNIRNLNQGIDQRREKLFDEYMNAKYSKFKMHSMEDYDKLKKVNKARSLTQSQFVRSEVMENVREYSNGESAFKYFTEKMEEDGLYILDEPENSLSPKRQLELKDFIEKSIRYFGCQFIISTHSPFLLAMSGAKIYDLDEKPVDLKKWTDLENVRIYYDFFKTYGNEF